MLAVMGEPSFRGNGDALGTSQESKRMLPDSQVEQPAGSINLTDLAASPAQLAKILKSAKPKAEFLNYWEKTDSCISLYTVIHTHIYISLYTHAHTFIHIIE